MYRIYRFDTQDQNGDYIEDRNSQLGGMYARVVEMIAESEVLNELTQAWDEARAQGGVVLVDNSGEILFSA